MLHKKRAYCKKSVKFSFYARNQRKSAVFKNKNRKSQKKIASAPSQAFLGTDLKAAVGPDGFMIGAEIAKATGLGRWVEYVWPNPVTGEIGYKRSWSIRHDGYLFGSGYDIEAPTGENE